MARRRGLGLGLGLGLGSGGASGANVISPLRFASVQNRSNQGASNWSGRDRYAFRVKHILGADMRSLALGSMNWILGNTEVNPGTDFTYEAVSLELEKNNVVVQIKWSGSNSKLHTNGANEVISDEIPASTFGATLNAGDVVWIKGVMSFASGASALLYGGILASDVVGHQTVFYASASTTPSDITTPGAFTFAGTAPNGVVNVHSPHLLGRPVDPNTLVYFAVGDSIAFGFSDNGTQGAFGRGFIQRAMHNGSFGNPKPSANFSTGGIGVSAFTGTNPKWAAWCKYANRGIDGLLTNNINGGTVPGKRTEIRTVWSRMKANGIEKIIRTGLMGRTTSTDSYATVANQTPAFTGWGAGEEVEQWNAWFPTEVGTNIEAFCSMSSLMDATTTWAWKTNGTAEYMVGDGLHPKDGGNSVGNATAAIALRSVMASLS